MSALSFQQFTKRYRTGQGVFDLDLTVDDGSFFGFIGENGAGKSTSIRCALSLMRPTSGAISLLGHDVSAGGAAAAKVREQVGYVPSEPGLWDGRDVAAVLAYVGALSGKDTSARRRSLCEALELDVTRVANDLSLGNKKKVSLVAALQHEPRLIVLDEPTSGLDPLIQQRLFDILRTEQQRGATVFFSSHVLAEVERYCSRVGIIKAGRLVKNATVAELMEGTARHVTGTRTTGFADAKAPSLDGVDNVVVDDDRISFTYRGALPALLRALADDGVTDVTIMKPSLEEIVLHHYGRRTNGAS